MLAPARGPARSLSLVLALAALSAPRPARADAYTWLDPYRNGLDWSDPAAWFNFQAPVSSATTRLFFLADADGRVRNDRAGDFLLNDMTLGPLAGKGWDMGGNRLLFMPGGGIASNANAGITNVVANAIRLQGPLTVSVTGGLTLTGAISGLPFLGSLTKSGAGVLTLSGANTYDGGTRILNGVVRAGGDDALGTGDLTLAGGALDLAGHGLAVKDLRLAYDGDGALTGGGRLRLAGDVRQDLVASDRIQGAVVSSDIELLSGSHRVGMGSGNAVAPFKTIRLTGALSGAGGLRLDTDCDVSLEGANTYRGDTVVEKGLLYVVPGKALSPNSALTIASGAYVFTGGTDQAVPLLQGGGTLALGLGSMTIGSSRDSTFSGSLASAMGMSETTTTNSVVSRKPTYADLYGKSLFAKVGTGTLTLSGSSPFAGTIAVRQGTLAVRSDAALGTTIGGKGFYADLLVAGGRVDVGASATVRRLTLGGDDLSGFPFGTLDGTGSLAVTGELSLGRAYREARIAVLTALTNTSVLSLGIGPGPSYDRISFERGLTFTVGGRLNVFDAGGFAAAAGDQYGLIGADSIAGTFSSISLPALSSGLAWDVSGLYTTGTIRVTQAVPEPASLAALGLGTLAFLRRRRRACP